MDEDIELKLITARKLAEMKKKAATASTPKQEKTSREIVLENLYDRGDEVLQKAYDSYPKETEMIVEQLAKLLKRAGWTERISGGELYELFRNLGLRFSLNTSIKIQEKGKFVDLKEKLKIKAEES